MRIRVNLDVNQPASTQLANGLEQQVAHSVYKGHALNPRTRTERAFL